jgi:hypothetical protein
VSLNGLYAPLDGADFFEMAVEAAPVGGAEISSKAGSIRRETV